MFLNKRKQQDMYNNLLRRKKRMIERLLTLLYPGSIIRLVLSNKKARNNLGSFIEASMQQIALQGA